MRGMIRRHTHSIDFMVIDIRRTKKFFVESYIACSYSCLTSATVVEYCNDSDLILQ